MSIDAWNQLCLGRHVRVLVSLSSCVAVYGTPVLVADCKTVSARACTCAQFGFHSCKAWPLVHGIEVF